MIRKPEDPSYVAIFAVLCGTIVGALILGWYGFLQLSYLTPNGASIPIQWDYVKACLNPFDQAFCDRVKSAMGTTSAERFYLVTTTFGVMPDRYLHIWLPHLGVGSADQATHREDRIVRCWRN
jgi:hypothetical protein